jgi:hypothetical protein
MGRANICTSLEGRSWLELLSSRLTPNEKEKLKSLNKSSVLSAIQLHQAVGNRLRAQKLMKSIEPILSEISLEGHRRCVYVFDNGVRCREYTLQGMCGSHMSAVANFTKHFKSQKLRDQFVTFMNDPHKMRLTGELSLLRVMLVQMISRSEHDVLPIQHIEAITVLCEKIMSMSVNMSKLNQLTPEVVDNILNKAVDVLAKYLPADRLMEAAKEIQALALVDPTAETPIDPGNFIVINEEPVRIGTNVEDPNAILRRTAMEEAVRLKREIEALQSEVDAEST